VFTDNKIKEFTVGIHYMEFKFGWFG